MKKNVEIHKKIRKYNMVKYNKLLDQHQLIFTDEVTLIFSTKVTSQKGKYISVLKVNL